VIGRDDVREPDRGIPGEQSGDLDPRPVDVDGHGHQAIAGGAEGVDRADVRRVLEDHGAARAADLRRDQMDSLLSAVGDEDLIGVGGDTEAIEVGGDRHPKTRQTERVVAHLAEE
jgi:hypothetical protein